MQDLLVGNDTGNSVMVPVGYQVDLYLDINLHGEHQTSYGLPRSDERMECVRLNDGLQNGLSSFTYGPLEFGKAIGRWEAAQTVNSSIDYEIKIGVETTDAESDTNSNK